MADASPPFGVYLHVPFCATRCGYCDFNTYTADELPDGGSRGAFPGLIAQELALAARDRPAQTVFVGGGTPTLLGAQGLRTMLDAVRDNFGLAPGAEVTVEANPETVTPPLLEGLLEAGVTRLSLGMQHIAPHVLAILDRVHTPGRPVQAAREARAAGFGHVSLDLIYGAPGETDDDWRAALDAALSAEPDHVSAYALIVEPGTRLAAQVRRGELPGPDDEALADRYEIADATLSAAGLRWYEISNWASDDAARCAHNVGYWTDGEWWGAGPGAHGFLDGERWWNLRHPSGYAKALGEGRLPVDGRERPTPRERRTERVMLELRTREGIAVADVDPAAVRRCAGEGLLEVHDGRAVLTRRGRLVCDTVVRALDQDQAIGSASIP